MQAGNGIIFDSTLKGLVSPDYAVFDPISNANVNFLGELFRCRKLRAKFRSESKGLGTGSSGFLRLYGDRLGAIHIALPSREELDAIMKDLEVRLLALNGATAVAERDIVLMREYRTRLVADVVTGQLDVREAARALPDVEPDDAIEVVESELELAEDDDSIETDEAA